MSKNKANINKSLFVNDYFRKAMHYCILVRSTVSRGKIKSITIPEIPEEYKIITAKHIKGNNFIKIWDTEVPILAKDNVNYKGEAILIITGPDERELYRIKNSILIDYIEEPELFSTYKPLDEQIIFSREIVKGTPYKHFKEAFQIIEGEYNTCSQDHAYSDPQGAFVFKEKKSTIIISASQWPFHVRDSVAEALGDDQKKIIVRSSEMSLPLDGKTWFPSLIACYAAIAHEISGKTIKFILPKNEDSEFSPKRAPVRIKQKTALNEKGEITSAQINITLNSGAYPVFSEEIIERMAASAMGAYICKHVRIKCKILKTNRVPMGQFSGFGLSSSFFAIETHMTRIAELIQRDPYNWKKDNYLKKNASSFTGEKFKTDPPGINLLESIVNKSDFLRKYSSYELIKKRRNTITNTGFALRGIGISTAYQGNSFLGEKEKIGKYSIKMRLEKDGTVMVYTSGTSKNSGSKKIWKDIISKELGIEKENIFFESPDTSIVPDSGPSVLSRNISIIAKVIENCCNTLKKKRFRSPLPLEIKRSFKLPAKIDWNSQKFTGVPFFSRTWGSAVVEVEIDPLTFHIIIKTVYLLIDAGAILNKESAISSLETSVLQALGWACYEHVPSSYKKNTTYQIPGIKELPKIEIDFINSEKQARPGGLAELPQCLIPSAFVTAVSQATGCYFDRLPITPEVIFNYLEEE